jgi:hypothetical protein
MFSNGQMQGPSANQVQSGKRCVRAADIFGLFINNIHFKIYKTSIYICKEAPQAEFRFVENLISEPTSSA